MAEIIFVLGSPRSGTTFIADEICKRLNTPLLPEAQWIIDKILSREIGNYSKKNWNTYVDICTQEIIDNVSLINNFKKECISRGLNFNYKIVEHTPQNILYLEKIISIPFNDIIQIQYLDNIIERYGNDFFFVAPLRSPEKSIASLNTQPWFNEGVMKAALFNLRCLIKLFKHREKIIFLDLDDQNISKKLDLLFAPLSEKKSCYVNTIKKSEELLKSHGYFNNLKSTTSKSIVGRLFSLPSIVLYKFLKTKVFKV